MEETLRPKPSVLDFLLFHFKVSPSFSSEQLAYEIKQFDSFEKKPKVAGLDLRDKVWAFIREKNWTGDEVDDFRIGSAVYRGWLMIFGGINLRCLMTKEGKSGVRSESWLMTKHLRKIERIQERKSNGIPLSPEQLKEISDAFDAWDSNIAKRYEEVNTNMFQKGIDEKIAVES